MSLSYVSLYERETDAGLHWSRHIMKTPSGLSVSATTTPSVGRHCIRLAKTYGDLNPTIRWMLLSLEGRKRVTHSMHIFWPKTTASITSSRTFRSNLNWNPNRKQKQKQQSQSQCNSNGNDNASHPHTNENVAKLSLESPRF